MAEEEKKEAEESEGLDEEGDESEESKKKGGSKLILIILAALVLIGGAGGGAFFFLNQGSDESAEAAMPEVGNPQAQVQNVAFYDVPDIVVNLSSSNGIARYLKVKLTLELNSELDIPRIEKLMPRIIDDFQVYLRQLRVEDLQGSAGIYRLKEALLMRANQSAAPIEVQNILFTEMLIQ
jgi:flagellar FliL protein